MFSALSPSCFVLLLKAGKQPTPILMLLNFRMDVALDGIGLGLHLVLNGIEVWIAFSIRSPLDYIEVWIAFYFGSH